MKCVRVASASIKLTEDRADAEKQADIAVIGTHAAQRAAKYARDGDYERAQMETRAAKRFMERNVDESSEDVRPPPRSFSKCRSCTYFLIRW